MPPKKTPKRKSLKRKSLNRKKRNQAKPVMQAMSETVSCKYDPITKESACERHVEKVVCTQKKGKVTCKTTN